MIGRRSQTHGDLADGESNRELPRLLALAWSLNKKEEKQQGRGGRRRRRKRREEEEEGGGRKAIEVAERSNPKGDAKEERDDVQSQGQKQTRTASKELR